MHRRRPRAATISAGATGLVLLLLLTPAAGLARDVAAVGPEVLADQTPPQPADDPVGARRDASKGGKGSPRHACGAALCAGGGRGDITPPVTAPLWGYGARAGYDDPSHYVEQRTQEPDTDLYTKGIFLRSEGLHTRLYARAIVLSDPDHGRMALVQVDTGSIAGEVFRAVANEVEALDIPRDRLLISATHTHGGPGASQQQVASAALVGDNYDPRIVGRLVDGIVAAVAEATEDLAPARVAIGETSITGVQQNRSLWAHDDNPCPDPDAIDDGTDCDPARDPDQRHRHGPFDPHGIDPTATMLRVDRTDGAPIGVWTSFANHGTVFGPQLLITGDNQGVAARLIEQGMLDRARDAGLELPSGWDPVAAYANGAEGDVNPHCTAYRDFACNEQNGTLQAEAYLDLYDELGTQLDDEMVFDARLDVLYMTGEGDTSPAAILGGGVCPPGGAEVPRHGNKCPLAVLTGSGAQWFWMQAVRLGDTVLTAVPGEMTVQMGRRLRKSVLDTPGNTTADGDQVVDRAIVVGLANDYLAYLTTPEEYAVQAYEGTFTLFGTQQGPHFAERMRLLVDSLLSGGPGPNYVEPPDTSATRTDNVSPLTQAASLLGEEPGAVVAGPPAIVERGAVVSLTWHGGQPSAEVVPDEAFVSTQRRSPDTAPRPGEGRALGIETGKGKARGHDRNRWETRFTDESMADLLTYDGTAGDDVWTTTWEVPLDAPTGTYRFLVTGRAYVGGELVDYELASHPFEVVASDDLTVTEVHVAGDEVLVRGAYPAPDPAIHFRLRPDAVTTGRATVRVTAFDGGVTEVVALWTPDREAFVANVTVPAGAQVVVPPGGLVDAWGNHHAA